MIFKNKRIKEKEFNNNNNKIDLGNKSTFKNFDFPKEKLTIEKIYQSNENILGIYVNKISNGKVESLKYENLFSVIYNKILKEYSNSKENINEKNEKEKYNLDKINSKSIIFLKNLYKDNNNNINKIEYEYKNDISDKIYEKIYLERKYKKKILQNIYKGNKLFDKLCNKNKNKNKNNNYNNISINNSSFDKDNKYLKFQNQLNKKNQENSSKLNKY
jgi:hypothetical protein